VDNTAIMEQDMVTVSMTREQYTDLMESLEVLGGDLEEMTKLQAVVNHFRDRGNVQASLAEVFHELKQKDSAPAANGWQTQAKFNHQVLAGLMTYIRKTLA